MALGFYFGMAVLLLVGPAAESNDIPAGNHSVECHDRFLLVSINVSFAEEECRFEAVDGTGVYPITKQYAAECGYTVSVLPVPGRVELRASYFSCHAQNQDDKVFKFRFNLIQDQGGLEVTYSLNQTCSLSLPWSPREINCEANYMEVSMRSELTCPSVAKNNSAARPDQSSSDWQVMFHAEAPTKPMNLSEARERGYVFDVTDKRLVFRTPYGQPASSSAMVNGVPVEVVHTTLFSRQSWVVAIVDLVAACSTYEGLYDDDGGYMLWAAPEAPHPMVTGQNETKVNVGVFGKLVEQPVAEYSGVKVERVDERVEISLPYHIGGYRKSVVLSDDLHEFYVFNLYVEQLLLDQSLDKDLELTRVRFHRTLATPLLPHPLFTENQSAADERVFTVYLGDVPEDMELTAVRLNGHEAPLPFGNASRRAVTEVEHRNRTRGFTLRVAFDDPAVKHQFSKEENTVEHILDVNFTLTIRPEDQPFVHSTSVTALINLSHPVFEAVCSDSGIAFKLDHRPFDFLWHFMIGSDLLTPQLATQRGYVLTNDSQSLQLEVPLFTHGYEYKDVALERFLGTFEILVKDQETAEVQTSAVKTCAFNVSEFIMCSTDGWMTVKADLSRAIPAGESAARANLLDKFCGPKEADDTRALFSVRLNGCGSKVKLSKEFVTYKNEILYSKKYTNASKDASEPEMERVMLQCQYPLAGLHRLFSEYTFKSDTAGIGRILHTSLSTLESPQNISSSTTRPTTVLQTTVYTTTTTAAKRYQPARHSPVRYIKVYPFRNFFRSAKGAGRVAQTKVNLAQTKVNLTQTKVNFTQTKVNLTQT